ncbi:hypothetical protein HA052_04585 [Chromobacterium haemolyticum]|uniref:PRTRC system protein F n=1 Tax=Chromobacterium fluminis TaxID=3044269 RepID=A0ABX0L619_9NEIS|nr:hypothetical protein [Chromobacterium haemolyticum]NHR04468.1 hypothetical protein [Chromobacterium haemolyticum]
MGSPDFIINQREVIPPIGITFGNGCSAPIIPKLGENFVPKVTLGTGLETKRREYALIALSMLDRPEMSNLAEIKEVFEPDILEKLLQHWLEQTHFSYWGGCFLFEDIKPYLPGDDDDDYQDEAEEVDCKPEAKHWLGLSLPNLGFINIGRAVSAIHTRIPVLAYVLMSLLEEVVEKGPFLVTPQQLLFRTQSLHWYGEEDEEIALNEQLHYANTEAAKEVVREDMVKLKDFTDSIPRYALHPARLEKLHLKRSYQKDIKWIRHKHWWNLSISGSKPIDKLCNRVLPTLKAIFTLLNEGACFPGLLDCRFDLCVEPSAVLTWDDGLLARRIEDDIYEGARNGNGMTDYLCCCPITTPNDLIRSLDEFQLGFRLLAETENLLKLLKEFHDTTKCKC